MADCAVDVVLINPLENPVEDDCPQDFLSDEVHRTISRIAFILCNAVIVLRTAKTFAGGKIKFTSTIRTKYQVGKHSLSLCLCWATFVRSQFLHPFKDSFFNNCFMGVTENCLLFLCRRNPLFQLVEL